jgi:hypothetical protein
VTTTIEHQAALARIGEMRRYATRPGGTMGQTGDAIRGAGREPSWRRSLAGCVLLEPTAL